MPVIYKLCNGTDEYHNGLRLTRRADEPVYQLEHLPRRKVTVHHLQCFPGDARVRAVLDGLVAHLEGMKLGAPLTELFIEAVRIDMASDTAPPEGHVWHYPFYR